MDNRQRHSICSQQHRIFRFSCFPDYKSPLQMALLYTHPKHSHINVDNLTMTPLWNFFHRTLKKCTLLFMQNPLTNDTFVLRIAKSKKEFQMNTYYILHKNNQSPIHQPCSNCNFQFCSPKFILLGWIPGFLRFFNSVNETWTWIAQIVKLQKSFKIIPNSYQFPGNWSSQIIF